MKLYKIYSAAGPFRDAAANIHNQSGHPFFFRGAVRREWSPVRSFLFHVFLRPARFSLFRQTIRKFGQLFLLTDNPSRINGVRFGFVHIVPKPHFYV